MKSRYFIFLILGIMVIGCAPAMRESQDIRESPENLIDCRPSDLNITAHDRRLELKWKTNCPSDRLIMGYFVYLESNPIEEKYLFSSDPPRKIQPYNLAPYPGDTEPDGEYETMIIDNLENGVEYFLSIRTVYPDNTVSLSSNQISAVCRPEGSFELAYRYGALNDGYSFASMATVRADAENNDLYFFSKDGVDFLASPRRLNGFLRESKFYSLGKTRDIYQYSRLTLDYAPVDKTPVLAGESYLIRTADGHYAKIRIEAVAGEGKQRKLDIKFIYQIKKELMQF